MKTTHIIEGLIILQKYRNQPADGYHVGAEHDVIYAYATDTPLAEPDLRRMVELGWFQEDIDYGDDCDETNGDEAHDNELAIKHYDANEGWACFT